MTGELKINNAKRAIAAACKRLGLPAHSHIAFRRTFITRAIERKRRAVVTPNAVGGFTKTAGSYPEHHIVNPVHSKRMAALMTTEQPDNVKGIPHEKLA